MVSVTFGNGVNDTRQCSKRVLCKYSPVLKHVLTFPTDAKHSAIKSVYVDPEPTKTVHITLQGVTPSAYRTVLDNLHVSSTLPGSRPAGFVHYGWVETVGIWQVGRLLEIEHVVVVMGRRLRGMGTYPLPSVREAQTVYIIMGRTCDSIPCSVSGHGDEDEDGLLPIRMMTEAIATHLLREVWSMGMSKDRAGASNTHPLINDRDERDAWRRVVERRYTEMPDLKRAVARRYEAKRDRYLGRKVVEADAAVEETAAQAALRLLMEEWVRRDTKAMSAEEDEEKDGTAENEEEEGDEEEEPRGRTRSRYRDCYR